MTKKIPYQTESEKKALTAIVDYLKERNGRATEPTITKKMLPTAPSNTQYRIGKLERHGVVKRTREMNGNRVDINNIHLLINDVEFYLKRKGEK